MPSRRPPPLSEAQLEIMNVVWGLGRCTVADVLERLNHNRSVARNTVQTMMSRLEQKGWLKHEDRDGTFVYGACVDRESMQQQLLDQVVKTVFDGSAAGVLMALLNEHSLTKAEAARIRKLIKDAEERK